MKKALVRVTALLLASAALAGGEWYSQPFSEWTEKQTLALLEDSPWAKQQPEEAFLARTPQLPPDPGYSPRVASEPWKGVSWRSYQVRFVSAKPLRLAQARRAMLSTGLSLAEAQALAARDPFDDAIVVAVAPPSNLARLAMDELTTDELRAETYLQLPRGNRKVPLQRYVGPSASGSGDAMFYFSRTEGGAALITAAARKVRFHSRLFETTVLDQTFALKEMVFRGKLEL